ncbi:MAG: MBL fold metallo-hydrolase [Kineosporiaceae bacterium]
MSTIERVVTSGVFSLDGQDFDVENNVWLVGDSRQVIVVDAAHDAHRILDAVGGRDVVAVVSTHGHNDHITAVADVVDATGAPVYLHPADRMLWDAVWGPGSPGAGRAPDPLALDDGQVLSVAGLDLRVLHTPGHSPGACSLHVPDLGAVLTGDTLFKGGPGATGRSFSSFPLILASIRASLLSLPEDTRVLTGHGDATSIGDEARDWDDWVTRGH